MHEIEIENLLFKQVEKPKHYLMTRIINVFDNRYRINIYTEITEDNLIKRKIDSSYFCHYSSGNLKIIPSNDTHRHSIKKDS